MITVLVVDDEPLVRLSVRSLEDWNAHHIDLAYEAGNGREALDLLGARPEIDVVLVDVDMPVMDGLEFAECLRGRGGTQGLLFLSSFDTFNYARRAFKAGAGDYILKSEMDEGRLLAAVQKVARGRAEKAEGGGGAALQERKNELVGRLLAGSLADIDGDAGAPHFNVTFPARPVFLRAADMQLVRKRYGDDLPAFSRITADLARQNLVSRKSGEAFSISFDRCLVLLDADEDPEAFFEEFSRAALNYLDMVFDAGFSDPLDSWRGLRQAYRQAENRFSVSSRLVVRARRYIREHYADPTPRPGGHRGLRGGEQEPPELGVRLGNRGDHHRLHRPGTDRGGQAAPPQHELQDLRDRGEGRLLQRGDLLPRLQEDHRHHRPRFRSLGPGRFPCKYVNESEAPSFTVPGRGGHNRPEEECKKTMKKLEMIALCFLVAAAAVFAGGAGEQKAGEKVVLKMGDNLTDRSTGWGAVVEKINAEFKAAHPDVEIVTESYQDQAWQEKVKIYATANQLPDVMKFWSFSTLLKPMVDGGFVEALDQETFKQYGYMAGSLEGNMIDGRLYGIPVSADLWVIYVNRKLFQDAGVAIPASWDDVIASAAKFKSIGIIPMVTDGKDGWPLCELFDNIQQRISGSFAPVDAAITRKAKYTDGNFVQTAAYIQSIVKAGVFQSDLITSDYGASRNLFGQGRAAMYMMGSWEMSLATDPAFPESFRNNLDVIKFPVVSGGKGTADDCLAWFGGNYIVSAKSKNKALALEYVKYYARQFPAYAWEAQACFPAQKVAAGPGDTVVAKKLLQIASEARSTSGTPGLDRSTEAFKEDHQDLMRQLAALIVTPEEFCARLDASAERASKE